MNMAIHKRVVLIAICVVIIISFAGCGSGDGTTGKQVSETYECKDFKLEIKDPVFLPGYNNALAIVWGIENTSAKDEYPLNFAHCKVYMDGVAINLFAGTYSQMWMDYFEAHNYRNSMTKFMQGGRLETYEIYIVDTDDVDSDDSIIIRFYKGLVGDEIIAEKEVLIKDIIHEKA